MKKAIISIIIIILAGAGVFVYLNLKEKKNWKINNSQENGWTSQENIVAQKDESEKGVLEHQDNNVINNTKKETETSAANDEVSIDIINKLVSWGYKAASSRQIDTVVIHSSYNALGGDVYNVDGLLKEYKSYAVSPHYLIDREGQIYRLVADGNIAYHAGAGRMPDGRINVNNFSLGIELMNTETSQFTDKQYAALKNLLAELKKKYSLKYILGHNQIAAGRKTDPWNFDWKKI